MTIEVDILKTLENIETLLESATALTKGKTPSASQQKGQQSQKQRYDKEMQKSFKAVAGSVKETDAALLGLNKSLTGLNTEVGRTTVGFDGLNAQILRFSASLQPVPTGALDGISASVNASIAAAITPLTAFIGALSAQSSMPTAPQQMANVMQQMQGVGRAANTTGQIISNMNVPWQMVLGRMLNRFGNTTVGVGSLGVAFDSFGEVVKKLTVDFLTLARTGMGSYGNLYSLSKNALLAGMSLKEYTEIVRENITFAARAGSLENFDKISSASDEQLAAMGIFGKEARALQASLANSSASMGVSQANLTNAIANQISVFDELRKSTNMTAEEFGDLIKSISKQEQVQKELVGLAPAQRAARSQELLQIQATGHRLGLAAEESRALADALMRQRGETVKNRFEQAGRVRQLSAFAGRGADGERAAQIILKGRAASAAELEELRTIAGSLDATTQGIYETGSFGAQNVIDVLGETLNGAAFGDLMKANRTAELAEVTRVNQEAFGKHVDAFGQFIGEALKYLRGFNESVLPAALTGIGATLAFAFRGTITKLISGLIPGAAGGAGLAQVIQAPVQALKTALSTLASPITATTSYIAQMAQGFRSARLAFGTGVASIGFAADAVSGIFSGTGSLARGLFRFLATATPLAAAIDGVMELFTGKLAKVMDPEGGIWSRIVGIATAALTALPQLVLDGMKFVFGDVVKPIQSVFDVIKTGITGAINGLGLALLSGVSWLTDLLPEDSGLRKMVDSAKESLERSLLANADTINALGGLMGAENRKTLKDITTEQEKAAASSSKTTKAIMASANAEHAKFNNIQHGMELSRGQLVTDAAAILGTPRVQERRQVTADTVNTQEPTSASAQTVAGRIEESPDLLAVLNSILQVLRDNLTEEQKQAAIAEQLLTRSRPTATFTPSEVMATRLLKQGLLT